MKDIECIPGSAKPDMRRRNFIGAGLSLVITGNLLSAQKVSAQPLSEQKAEEKLLAILNDSSSATLAGLAILETATPNLSASELLNSLIENLGLTFDTLNLLTRGEIATRFKQQTLNDFDSGRTLSISGWRLSQTESQFCLLAANKWLSDRGLVG
jgi:hypothetical protein